MVNISQKMALYLEVTDHMFAKYLKYLDLDKETHQFHHYLSSIEFLYTLLVATVHGLVIDKNQLEDYRSSLKMMKNLPLIWHPQVLL